MLIIQQMTCMFLLSLSFFAAFIYLHSFFRKPYHILLVSPVFYSMRSVLVYFQ